MKLVAEASQLSNEIAFCGQTPWVHEGTIYDNIIGETAFDRERQERGPGKLPHKELGVEFVLRMHRLLSKSRTRPAVRISPPAPSAS